MQTAEMYAGCVSGGIPKDLSKAWTVRCMAKLGYPGFYLESRALALWRGLVRVASAPGFGDGANPQNGWTHSIYFPEIWGGGCQSSPGIITVMAGRASSISSGPQVAINFTRRGLRLSLRTYKATGRRSAPGRERRMAKRSIHKISQSRPGSSWAVTPGGTVT